MVTSQLVGCAAPAVPDFQVLRRRREFVLNISRVPAYPASGLPLHLVEFRFG